MEETVLISISSVMITTIALLYTIYKDKVRNAKEEGRTDEILRGIEKELRSIKESQSIYVGKLEVFSLRLAKIEDSAKSAHKRIDGLATKLERN